MNEFFNNAVTQQSLITMTGRAQKEGQIVSGYAFPSDISEFAVPATILFHPNYAAYLITDSGSKEITSGKIDIIAVDSINKRLIVSNDSYLKWFPNGKRGDEVVMVISAKQSGISTATPNNETVENQLVNLADGSGFGAFMSGQKRMMAFASVGSLYGFYRAYQGNKKIGGYIGNALLFSLIGYAAGYLSLKVVPPKSNAIVTQGGTNSFSNDGEFKNAVSNQNLVSSKKVNCDCDRILRWDVQMIGGRPYYVGKWMGKGTITQTQTPNGVYISCQSNPKCGNDEKYVAINPPQPVILPI